MGFFLVSSKIILDSLTDTLQKRKAQKIKSVTLQLKKWLNRPKINLYKTKHLSLILGYHRSV